MKKNYIFLFLILISVILYLCICAFMLHRPLVGDETINLAQSQTLQFGLSHPPLYYDILKILAYFLGIAKENTRLLGIFCFLFTLFLIYLLSRQVYGDRRVGVLACLLYLIHPLAIQGSMLIDIDNTILSVLLMVFILYFSRHYEDNALKNTIFLGFLFFICLWAKLSTPVLVLISVFIFYIFRGQVKKGIINTSIIAGLGCSLFLLFWFIYSYIYNINFFKIFNRSIEVISKHSSGPTFFGFKELGLRITRIYLWLGPYFTILWALIIILRIRDYFLGKKESRLIDFLILYTLVIFFSYIIIGGTCFGFAKYHYPILSIMSIVISEFSLGLLPFKIKKRFIFYFALGFLFVVLEWTKIGDLLYRLNYTLRQVALSRPEKINNFLLDVINRFILYHLTLIIGVSSFYFIDKKKDRIKNSAILLLGLIFISNISLDIRQINADYFTTYCYGRNIKEYKQLEIFLRNIHTKNPNGTIIGPEDVLFSAIGHWYPGYTYDVFWNNRNKFLQAIKEKKVCCVAYGFSWNAISSFKNIFYHPLIIEVLRKQYRFYSLGEYSVWLRK